MLNATAPGLAAAIFALTDSAIANAIDYVAFNPRRDTLGTLYLKFRTDDDARAAFAEFVRMDARVRHAPRHVVAVDGRNCWLDADLDYCGLYVAINGPHRPVELEQHGEEAA